MHKLVTGPSKAKTRALARLVMALVCCAAWAAGAAWASDIVIRSGEGEDTVMQVGPGVGSDGDDGNMRIESDPDNGTLMQVTPQPRDNDAQQYQGPIIIAPEIHTRGRK
ncbi:hypothetical protein [Desulfomicrobium escambiense]|uniref:hypothetical protein n=1 Tax=Desulfomicrobium escambiense TaxID=29503 RepID=UPI0012ECB403|nr:hypothetical protein [Desulfomicrobium escambiense]